MGLVYSWIMIKRVIIVSPRYSIYRAPIAKALNEMGIETEFFNNRQGWVYENRLAKAIVRRFRFGRMLKMATKIKVNKLLLDRVLDFKPDMILMSGGESIFPETIFEIKRRGVITANWYTEFMHHWHVIQEIAPAYDFFFHPDPYVIRELKNIGLKNTHYLPFPADEIIQGDPFKNREDKYTISFIGSNVGWPKREKFFDLLKDFDLNIWGPPTWLKTKLKNCYRGSANPYELARIYRRTKFVIDIPWDHLPAEGISVRPFEAMVNGTCLLFYDIRTEMSNLFKKNVEYVSFLNEQELVAKIRYFIEHETERKKIALAGYEETLKNHTYEIRMKQMMEMMGLAI